MADRTGINWADVTWNPLVGCSPTSPACDSCYAARDAAGRLSHLPTYAGLTVRRDDGRAELTGEIRLLRDRLDQPCHWRRPRRIFVASTSDLFHPKVRVEYIAEVFAVMALVEHHTFLLLTKRPQRMAAVLGDVDFWETAVRSAAGRLAQPVEHGGLGQPAQRRLVEHSEQLAVQRWPLRHVWAGTTIESDRYRFRAAHLRDVPAAVRWISAEPLLGPLDRLDLGGIDWLVAGGESGAPARPMEEGWVRDLRDRCAATGTAFWFKQAGAKLARRWGTRDRNGGQLEEIPGEFRIRELPGR